MNNKLLGLTIGFLVYFSTLQVHASSVFLGATNINFNASGTPNTISGSWSANPLIIDNGSFIEYFTLEITSVINDNIIESPSALELSAFTLNDIVNHGGASGGLSFCSNCRLTFTVGTLQVASNLTGAGEWNLLNMLLADFPISIPIKNTQINYPGGGPTNITASGSILVKAYGISAVPIPPAIILMVSGLLGLLGISFTNFNKPI